MKSRLIVLIMFALAATVLESCYDEKDTIAQIRVVTANDTAVPGAEVRIFGRATETSGEVGNVTIDTISFTDARGLAEFDFTNYYKPGQSGFAILDVEVTAEFPNNTVFLEGIIRVVEQETTRRTFTVE